MGMPLYYCPPGIDAPHHIALRAPFALRPEAGPDGADPGGRMFGGPLESDRNWHCTRDGWWLSLTGCQPRDLVRLTPIPGPVIPGAVAGHTWMVPQILRLAAGGHLVMDLPRTLREYRWQVDPALEDLSRRLRDAVEGRREVTDDELLNLTIDLLQVNYHVTIHELTLGDGCPWMDEPMALAVIKAAGGL